MRSFCNQELQALAMIWLFIPYQNQCNRSESPQRMLTSLLKSEEVVRRPLGDVLQ